MLYTIEIKEIYKTLVTIKADTERDALVRLDAAREDIREGRLIDHWLERGFQGCTTNIKDIREANEDNDWMWDFTADQLIYANKPKPA